MIKQEKKTLTSEWKFKLVLTDDKEMVAFVSEERGDRENGREHWISLTGNHPRLEMPVFPFVNRLMREIRVMAEREDISFFWFNPTDCRRMQLFHLLAARMVRQLGKGWEYSLFDDKWFYFMKLED